MDLILNTSLKLTPKRAAKILTEEEIEAGQPIAFRVTMSECGYYVKAERLEREVSPIQVGGNVEVLDNGSMVIDALIRPIAKGDLMPGVGIQRKAAVFAQIAPLVAIEDMKGFFFEEFHLRTPFLPLEGDLLDKYESLSLGIATIDIEKQIVVDLEVVEDFDNFNCRERKVGDNMICTDENKFKIVCKLANGGCNFGCYIRSGALSR